jgi:hypothetical protein
VSTVSSCRHGTHTSGTIGALRNGHGVVGVSSEGAQVYHYNYFGPNMAASDDLEVAAWQECIAELDRCGEAGAAQCTQQALMHRASSSCWVAVNQLCAACDVQLVAQRFSKCKLCSVMYRLVGDCKGIYALQIL